MKSPLTKEKTESSRYIMVDVCRGFAVLLMIFYHLVFDLNGFRLMDIDLLGNPFWYALPRFIVSIFLVCVGMGLTLAHKKRIEYSRAIKRLAMIGAWALVITLITYILYPKNFIFFGTLHCIFLSSIGGLFFVKRPKTSLIISLMLMVPCLIFDFRLIPLSKWLGVEPFDYVPLYPWFGMVLLGIFIESLGLHKVDLKRTFLISILEKMGRHSLKIYIIHRPILIGLVFFVYKII